MMVRRYISSAIVTLAASVAMMGSHASAPADEARAALQVPETALTALREGRYLRASEIMHDFLAAHGDSAPGAVLFTAQAEAGLGDWEAVEKLLKGKPWLDSIGAGHGWDLLGNSQLQLGHFDESGRSFARYIEVAPVAGNKQQGVAEIRKATAFANAGKYESAIAAYDRAAKLLPQIKDWIEIFAASTAATRGDTAAVRMRLDSTDGTLARDWGWRSRVRAKQNAKDLKGALASALLATQLLPSTVSRSEAWLRAAEIRKAMGDASGARAAYREAMVANPASDPAIEAANAIRVLGGITPRENLLMGRVYLRQGNAAKGIAALRAYLASPSLGDDDQLGAQLELGRALFNNGKYAEAIATLRAYATSASNKESAADALYTATRALYRNGDETGARNLVQTLLSDYAGTKAAASAAFLHGDLDHDDGDLKSAESYYRKAIEMAPGSDDAGLARMRLAGMAYQNKDYAGALDEYKAYLKSFPDGKRAQQATYWSALALQQQGDADSAEVLLRRTRRMDPFTYYSDKAADALKQPFWNVAMAQSPPSNSTFDTQVANALARVDLLKEVGWNDAATTEMQRARTHFAAISGASYSLGEALNARGYTAAGISVGWEIYRREGAWNKRLLRIIYPFPYQNIIVAEARERHVDPYFAAGLIRQESTFNPKARSGPGAMGLMQVMPKTGKVLAKSMKIRRFKPSMLETAEVNVRMGMAYLKDQLSTYNNRFPRVLAAYNAGPTRVDRWSQFPEYSDDALFTERIPFEETRDYVKIVQHNARMYQALYGPADDDAAPPAARPK